MTDIYLIGALALVAVAVAFLAGRFLAAPKRLDAGPPDQSAALELVRLQERERLLSQQLKDQSDDASALKAQLDAQGLVLNAAQQKSAADDERISALEKALAREKEVSQTALQDVSNRLADVTQIKEALQADFTAQAQKLAAAERLETELRAQIARAVQHITDRDDKIRALAGQIDDIRATLADKARELSVAAERESGLNRTIAERDEQLKGLQQQLKVEFENIANKVLAASADQLSEKSKESLTAILEPLKSKISEFQQRVETAHTEDTAQRSALSKHIETIVQANLSIGEQAEELAKALKGDSQIRGRWGEVRLERILEKSGLVRGREFVVQGGDFNIKGEDGGSQRPDVVILLPEHRHFVIDSKVSLVDYLAYEGADNDEDRDVALQKLVASVRGHIDGLASKNYQYANAINSHECVFMFMPIEGVAAVVLRTDEDILEYAWKRKIVLVSPSTLFMTMQTVQSIWRYEHQSENAQAIADQAGQLYDKLAAVVSDLNDVSHKISAAADAHSEAMKKLASGRGNALGRAQKLKQLGVRSKKELPAVSIDGERLEVAADGDDDILVEALPATKLLEQSGDQ